MPSLEGLPQRVRWLPLLDAVYKQDQSRDSFILALQERISELERRGT